MIQERTYGDFRFITSRHSYSLNLTPLTSSRLNSHDVRKRHMRQTWSHRPLQPDVRRSRRLDVANDAHRLGAARGGPDFNDTASGGWAAD